MYTIRFNVRPYLAEYLSMKYSWPQKGACKIPPSSELHYLFLDLLSRRPIGAGRDTGNVEFILPNHARGKKTETHNYLSGRSREKIEQWIYCQFWAEFHRFAEYHIHIKGTSLLMSVLLFKSKYNINSLSQDAFIKNFQRWRDRQAYQRRVYRQSNL